MTRRLTEDRFTAFSRWWNENPRLDARTCRLNVSNLDYIAFGWGRPETYLMLIEEKRFGAALKDTQRELFDTLDFVLRQYKGAVPALRGKWKPLRYFGFHVLRFAGEGPSDSASIHWDNHQISVAQLEALLRFDLDPVTLNALVA